MITRLNWESNFFEFEIGQVELEVIKNTAGIELSTMTPESLDKPFQLLMNKVPSTDNYQVNALSLLGFEFVEGEAILHKELDSCAKCQCKHPLTSAAKLSDFDKIKKIVKHKFRESRFRPPWFSDAQRQMFYAKWLENAIRGIHDDICLVERIDNEFSGIITLRGLDTPIVSIGLLAVADGAERQGVGRKLIKRAEEYSMLHGAVEMCVATQMSNVRALNFYFSNGYTLAKTNYWFYKRIST